MLTKYILSRDRICNETLGLCHHLKIKELDLVDVVDNILATKPSYLANDDFVTQGRVCPESPLDFIVIGHRDNKVGVPPEEMPVAADGRECIVRVTAVGVKVDFDGPHNTGNNITTNR